MLQEVGTSVDDPIITDNTVMTRAEKRFSTQTYCGAKRCRWSNEFPEVFGFEAWKQLYDEFEPRPPENSKGTCRALLSPAKSDESLQTVPSARGRTEDP